MLHLTPVVVFIILQVVQPSIGEYSSNLTETKAIIFNVPKSCANSWDRNSGIQIIQPQPGFGQPFGVFCDQDYEGGGWTVIQNRYDGSVNFYRGWNQYEEGFGDMEGEFWLGLKKIHELTYSRKYELVILLDDWEGYRAVARYSHFSVAGPEEKYTLKSLGTYSGTAGDSLKYHVGMKFSTLDAKNDIFSSSCAVQYQGAWWYRNCIESNLNGVYMKGTVPEIAGLMMSWKLFKGFNYGLKSSRMMIKVVN